jgi:hypothetical protein
VEGTALLNVTVKFHPCFALAAEKFRTPGGVCGGLRILGRESSKGLPERREKNFKSVQPVPRARRIEERPVPNSQLFVEFIAVAISCVSLRNFLDKLSTICYTLIMSKMGRPKKPAKERSSILIALRLTPAERLTLERSATKAGLSLSNYIRLKLELRGES